MDTLIDFLSAALPDYVTPDNKGIHLEGFIYLFQLFIDKNRPESCWQVLRSFGYNNHLELEIPLERITVPLHEMDQIAQLSSSAIGFLNALFKQFDTNKDEKLTEIEIDEIFSICSEPKAPWNICSPTKMLLFEQTIDSNGLTLSSWFACWNYFMLTNPKKTLELLFYLGYDDKHAPAIVFSK
jgi:Ras family protein T1